MNEVLKINYETEQPTQYQKKSEFLNLFYQIGKEDEAILRLISYRSLQITLG